MQLVIGRFDPFALVAARFKNRARAGFAGKLWAAFGAIIAVYFALATAIGINLAALRDHLDHVTTVAEPMSAVAYEMEIKVIESGMGVLKYLQQPDPSYIAHVEEDRAEFEKFHAQYMRLATNDMLRDFGREVGRLFGAYRALGDELIAAKNAAADLKNLAMPQTAIAQKFPEFIELRRRLDYLLDDNIQFLAQVQLRARSEDAHGQIAAAMSLLAGFGGIAVIAALVAAAYLSRHVIGPVRELAQGTISLGHGRLDHRVPVRAPDEFGELAGAFNRMAALLEEGTGEREARYRAVIDRVADGILIVANDGRVIDRNPAADRLFGSVLTAIIDCPVELLIEPPGGDLPSPAEAGSAKAGAALAINAGAARSLRDAGDAQAWLGAIGREAHAMRADGTRVPVELSVGVFGRAGEPISVVLIHDVTEHKKTLAALERNSAELMRSNADLEQFAYVATHDMQEPLRAVAGYCGLLKRRYGERLEGEGQRLIANAIDGVKRLQALIDDLLQFSRVGRGAGAPAPADAGEALRRALRNLEAAIAESNAVITIDDLPAVMADCGELVQLFQNLIGNAIKYRGAAPPRIRVSAERWPDRIVIAVSDNGIGIAPEHHERVFGIFQRLHTREDYPGTGIGLAICRKIVERRHGRIWIESRPGQGCTVCFTLPTERAIAA